MTGIKPLLGTNQQRVKGRAMKSDVVDNQYVLAIPRQ